MVPNFKFSFVALKEAVFYMALSALVGLVIAFVTFESEYYAGIGFERILEFMGILRSHWLAGNNNLFLHTIQILFVITFFIEVKFIIFKFYKDLKL